MERRERSITDDIMDRLEAEPGSFVLKVKGGAAQRSGLPDLYFTCAALDGRSVWFEVKRPGKGLRKLQRYNVNGLRNAGAAVATVRSVDNVELVLEKLKEEACRRRDASRRASRSSRSSDARRGSRIGSG